MDNEIQLISDGDGLAVIGSGTDVERFLAAEGLPSKELGLHRLGAALRAGSAAAQAGSELAVNSGRWVKLSPKSAALLNRMPAMKGSQSGLSRAVLMKDGKIKHLLEFSRTTPGAILTNPAILAGAAGIMAQLAMQQTMDEITDYLATIDAKVDDILRAQKDEVLASMIGVDFVVEEAMTVREQVGHVSPVTWSKVQATALTVAQTQAYALRQLDAVAEKLERETKVSELADLAKESERTVQEWLAVLARCFQLQDAIAILELDRVLEASPEELDQHRLGLRIARQRRTELIAKSTERLIRRMDEAAQRADAKILFHPTASPAVVASRNHVVKGVLEFDERLGIESAREALDARPWLEAVGEVRDRALEAGAHGVDTARDIGSDTLDRTRSVVGRFADRTFRRGGGGDRA